MKDIKRKLIVIKNRKVIKKFNDFFEWIKGAKLVELNTCDIDEDPVRPELDIEFRRSYGRKIYGVEYKNKLCAIMCFGFTNKVPKTVNELDLFTKDAYLQSAQRDQKIGKIAKPKLIFQLSDLPKTRTGKIMRRLLKAKLTGNPLGDLSSLENPDILKEIDKFKI